MDGDYDYELDYYSDTEYDGIYEDYGGIYPSIMDYTIQDLWHDCLLPTLSDGFNSSSKLLVCCMLLKLTLSLNFLPEYAFHITSSLTGLYCLYHFFENEILYIILFAVVGYGILLLTNIILKQYQGIVCVFANYAFLIICELFFAEKTLWHRIRGSQMLLSMKLISLAFDTGSIAKTMPETFACFGYLFHPGTVIFGPWISYTTYINSKQN
ncbi:Protein-cysteine N-palmitoyltransferase porcupine, partial [Stegodyphus mimosarum]